MANDLGCTIGQNVIACRKEAGTGCPGADGGPHYFIYSPYMGDGRHCMDCGVPETELEEGNDGTDN